VSPDERWLAANWPFVRAWLPAVPARVAEVGCGPLGGFVPRMEAESYQATGIDPQAPPGPSYRRALFEDCAVPAPLVLRPVPTGPLTGLSFAGPYIVPARPWGRWR
jgi:hypothetical protein